MKKDSVKETRKSRRFNERTSERSSVLDFQSKTGDLSN